MDKIKNLFINHFEKMVLAVAVIIALMALVRAFSSGESRVLREDIDDLIYTIEENMDSPDLEKQYDPTEIPAYDKAVLKPFQHLPDPIQLSDLRWYMQGIVELDPIKLELPPGVPFEKEYPTETEATLVTIDNKDLATVELKDPETFILKRNVEEEEGGTTLIHIWKGEEHYVKLLEIAIRIIYVPRAPQDVVGYSRPGRSVVIWLTHPRDIEHVVGFNVYRKDTEEGEFDLENPLNGFDLIKPLTYVPRIGEGTEEGEEGEKAGPGREPGGERGGERPEVGEPDEEKPHAPPGPEDADESEFGLPGEDSDLRGFDPDRKVAGRFIDRNTTPMTTYWYAVETVAARPAEEDEGTAAVGEDGRPAYVKSVLSEQVAITGADVMKMAFRTLLGRLKPPEEKANAKVAIEIMRFVKVAWISGQFLFKIGDKIEGRTWVRKYPEMDPETEEVTFVGKMIDFKSRFVLKDILYAIKKLPVERMKAVVDPETGRIIMEKVKEYVEVKVYTIIVEHEEGYTEQMEMEKRKRRSKKEKGEKRATRKPPKSEKRPDGTGPGGWPDGKH